MALTQAILDKIEPNYGEDRLEPADVTELPVLTRTYFEINNLYKIETVEKVHRRFLLAAFSLRKKEYDIKHGEFQTMNLLHHTSPTNVNSILHTNLDIKRVVRAKYGQGVSFTNDPIYGHKYSNGFLSRQAIIVADVLVKNTCFTNFTADFDTTLSINGKVYVKYRDDEFMPKYIVHYNGPQKYSRYRRFF